MWRASLVCHKEVAASALLELLAPVRTQLEMVEARISQATETDQALLTEAYGELFAGGKRLRPAVTLLSAGPEHSGRSEVLALATALEMLHTATLIHDDIIDRSAVRRGKATVSARHGSDVAILAGDHLFARAAVIVTETGNLEALRVFAQTLVTISAGELAQIWRRSRLPGLEEYLQLIYAKTACLFESAALGGALLAGRCREDVARFASYGRNLGLAFQIADDVLDYTGDSSLMGKPTLNDLGRGLLTLPVLLYAWQFPDWVGRELPAAVPEEDLQHLAEAVYAGGFAATALSMAREYADRAWESVAGLQDGAFAESLWAMTRFAIERAT